MTGITYNQEVPVHLSAEAVLSGGPVTVTVIEAWPAVADDPNTPNVNEYRAESSTYQKVTYDVAKLICNDASIDTRKAHGQPNAAGQLPGDPNAPAQNVNFGPSIWKGGLFAGNLPWPTRDASGTARMQFYTSSTTTAPRLAALSLFDLGSHATFNGNVTLGVYVPKANDSNLNTTESTVTWANKWNIVPRAEPGENPRDDSQDPLTKFTFSGLTPLNGLSDLATHQGIPNNTRNESTGHHSSVHRC